MSTVIENLGEQFFTYSRLFFICEFDRGFVHEDDENAVDFKKIERISRNF